MFQNGKLFLQPPNDGSDWKELFKKMAAAGAGRALDEDGFPAGPWTPELLAEAISQIDSNRAGVDLRTVQLWFQENDKGISAANIRWLARVFGCDDPEATAAWQVELSAAQARLQAKRREARKADSRAPDRPGVSPEPGVDEEQSSSVEFTPDAEADRKKQRFSLARKSEAFFSSGSPLNLPASVFAGASALGFLSYIVGIHSAVYLRADNISKEVGFLWAPNWTFLFMVLLPLFFALVTELLAFWTKEGRAKLWAWSDTTTSDDDWARNVEGSSFSYWAVFLICVLFAGVFQWIGVCLIPLLEGGADYATSWGTLAIVRPEVISVPVSIGFTALAYFYMSLCFYLFFAGLILLHTMIHDLRKIDLEAKIHQQGGYQGEVYELCLRLMRGIFRCTILGLLVALCMKAQSSYLTSNAKNILDWLIGDMSSALAGRDGVSNGLHYRMPTHYSSLLVAISTIVVFFYGSICLRGIGTRFHLPLWKMAAVVTLLFATYLLIDAFVGFSIVLGIGVLVAVFSLVDPGLGSRQSNEVGSRQIVS
ncbi:RcgA family putative transporter [Rhizobium sp. RAF56]|uniref:RcgA family putative transporter n=1 Tax=Rhizobium sp. RAF56 TaxID=3233062 RepID=UPI003F9DAB27